LEWGEGELLDTNACKITVNLPFSTTLNIRTAVRPMKNIQFALLCCVVSAALCAMGCGNRDQESAKPPPTAQDQIQRIQNDPKMSPEAKESAIKIYSNPVPNATSQH